MISRNKNMIEEQVSKVEFCKRLGGRRTGKGKLPKKLSTARKEASGVR